MSSLLKWSASISGAESKEKHGVWDPLPELTITSPYVDSREPTPTHAPWATQLSESTLTLCQSPDFIPLSGTLDLASDNHSFILIGLPPEGANKNFPTPGVEPGPAGWKPAILTVIPRGNVIMVYRFSKYIFNKKNLCPGPGKICWHSHTSCYICSSHFFDQGNSNLQLL